MTKKELMDKVQAGNFTPEKLARWIQCLPSSSNAKPTKYKKGDVLMHPVFNHPYVLLHRKRGYWLATLITSEETCNEILEPCESRFFDKSFISKSIFTVTKVTGSFVATYDNHDHLNSVRKSLIEIVTVK